MPLREAIAATIMSSQKSAPVAVTVIKCVIGSVRTAAVPAAVVPPLLQCAVLHSLTTSRPAHCLCTAHCLCSYMTGDVTIQGLMAVPCIVGQVGRGKG